MAQTTKDLFHEDVDSEDEDWTEISEKSLEVPRVGGSPHVCSAWIQSLIPLGRVAKRSDGTRHEQPVSY